MKQNSILAVLGLALAAASPSLTFAANGTPSTTAEQSRADTILRQMSNTLGAAQYFSFKVDREIDPPLAKKLGLQERTRIEVAVRRPDKLVALSTSKADVRKLFADGRQLTVFDVKQNLYSTVPMPASLDALPAKLAEKYGFAPPAGGIRRQRSLQGHPLAYQEPNVPRNCQTQQRFSQPSGMPSRGSLGQPRRRGALDCRHRSPSQETDRQDQGKFRRSRRTNDRLLGLEHGGEASGSGVRLHAIQERAADSHDYNERNAGRNEAITATRTVKPQQDRYYENIDAIY